MKLQMYVCTGKVGWVNDPHPKAFCEWGEGPSDVGLNLYDGPPGQDGAASIAAWLSMTADDAERLARELLKAARRARQAEQSYEEYMRDHPVEADADQGR